jgi:hypothetical protein
MNFNISKDKHYGILLSGGIDSAILLYLLIKEEPKIRIQPFTIPKNDGAYLYANPIIDHFNNKFNLTIPHTIKVGNIKLHHSEQGKDASFEINRFYKSIDILFNALNAVPPELQDGRQPMRSTKEPSPKVKFPFVSMYKDQILQIMYDEGQTDLINLTHSCTERSIGRCNVCWQCCERIWAFNQLNQVDTGTK